MVDHATPLLFGRDNGQRARRGLGLGVGEQSTVEEVGEVTMSESGSVSTASTKREVGEGMDVQL